MKLAHAIQAVVSRLILTLAFLLVVAPLGILAKVVGKKFLVRKPDPGSRHLLADPRAGRVGRGFLSTPVLNIRSPEKI